MTAKFLAPMPVTGTTSKRLSTQAGSPKRRCAKAWKTARPRATDLTDLDGPEVFGPSIPYL